MKYLPFIILPLLSVLVLLVLEMSNRPFLDPLWEIVHTPNSSAEIMRTPVPHGWLVAYKSLARSIVYVLDENHKWKLNEKPLSN